jgi:hypothetical protein
MAASKSAGAAVNAKRVIRADVDEQTAQDADRRDRGDQADRRANGPNAKAAPHNPSDDVLRGRAKGDAHTNLLTLQRNGICHLPVDADRGQYHRETAKIRGQHA